MFASDEDDREAEWVLLPWHHKVGASVVSTA